MKRLIELLIKRFSEQKYLEAHDAYNISRFGNVRDVSQVVKRRIQAIEEQIKWAAAERKTSVIIEYPENEQEVNKEITRHFGELCGYKLFSVDHPEDKNMHYLIISWAGVKKKREEV